MAPLQEKNLDAFSYCAVSATEYCTLMYWVSAGIISALAVSVFAFSVLCCISRRRRTPSRRSETLPYYTFGDNRKQASRGTPLPFASMHSKMRASAEGYEKIETVAERGHNPGSLREGSPILDQSDNVYAYTTTGRDGGKTEKDSRLNTETYTYARASNLDRVAADSDSDSESGDTSDRIPATMDLSGCSGDIQVSIDYAQVSDLVFCKPPSSEKALFTTFVHKKYNIIPKGALKSQQVIGSGQFGAVHSGLLNTTSGFTKCAIKTLHEGHTPEDKVKFLQEAAIVGQFNHPQIVKLFGVVMDGPTTMIVLELLPLGDLRQHLIDIKLKLEKPSQDILQKSFLSYARQIAEGMNYLASKNFIHRDLAARNILMADENTCKIGDFGLSRDLVDEEFYLSRGGQIPMKWTSIEAIEFRQYSVSSDVWSYGVLLFEIWTMGEKPFRWIEPPEVLRRLKCGERLHPPPGCPRAIYRMMMECWHPNPSERLTFADIVFRLEFGEQALLDMGKVRGGEECILGSQLSAGERLYPDLQKLYRH